MAESRRTSLKKDDSRFKHRRQSYGFGSVPGISEEYNSGANGEVRRPVLKYLPTYRIESQNPFEAKYIDKIIEDLVPVAFDSHQYHFLHSPALALSLSKEILKQARLLDFDRYRIISVVAIGQKIAQSYSNAITFLWDEERDAYVNYTRETLYCIIQVTVFGVYLD